MRMPSPPEFGLDLAPPLSDRIINGVAPRLRPGTSPHAFRILPLTTDILPSGCLSTEHQLGFPLGCIRRFQLRARSGFPLSGLSRPARHYPRFRIWRPSSERRRDFNPPDPGAARHTLRVPPTSPRHCFRPRCPGLSGNAHTMRRRWDLPGYCTFLLSGSKRPAIPGGRNILTLMNVTLLPAGVLIPSALSKAVVPGLYTFTVSMICYQFTGKARYPARG